MGLNQAPARASPPRTWTTASAAPATSPANAPLHNMSRGGCKVHAQAITQGRASHRSGPSRPSPEPLQRIDAATTSRGPAVASRASHQGQPIVRTAPARRSGINRLEPSSSSPNGSRPLGTVSTSAGSDHRAAAAHARAQRSRLAPVPWYSIASIRGPDPRHALGAASSPVNAERTVSLRPTAALRGLAGASLVARLARGSAFTF